MKKILIILLLVSLIFSPNFAFSEYLVTGKNYYTDNSIKKWFLDEEISENTVLKANFDSLKKSSEKNFIIWKDGMTFNEFYLANNISPEDNFYAWLNPWFPLIYLDDAQTIKLNSNYTPKAPFVTYVWPTNNDGWPYWTRNPAAITKPSFFSRLTVGELEKWTFSTDNNNVQTPNENKKLLKFDRDWYIFPNMIWYGENNTVNDYMLTAENNFAIPARYNTVRNDVHLTLRSQGFWWFDNNDARGFLEVKEGNENIVSKKENPKKYINTKTNIFITPMGFAQLGDDRWGWWIPGWKTIVKGWRYKEVSKNMQNISAENFVKNINNLLKEITQYSGTNSIASWNGWQIQMEWFYRDGADTDFLIDQKNRESDAQKILDVKFFMYYNGVDSVNIRGTKLNVTTSKASNGKNLYSPNESVFKIEITRPYFLNFWNLNDEIIFDEKNFDEKLWEKSFEILDAGLEKNWNKIWVDKSRIKLRLSEDGVNFSDKKFTFDELKQEFQKDENVWKTFKIAYTYAAKDANDENIWKLPNEITDNTGAFAIPFLRSIKIPNKIIIKYLDENGLDQILNETITGLEWENYDLSTFKKEIPWYEFVKIEDWKSENWQFKKWKEEVSFIYKKLPENSKIIVKYLDENWQEIQNNEEKIWKIWEDYDLSIFKKEIPNYEFVNAEWDLEWKFEKTEKTVILKYKKIVINPNNPINPVEKKWILKIKYLDIDWNDILAEEIKTGKIWEDYNFEPKEILDYDFLEIKSWDSKTWKYEKDEKLLRFIYKKILKENLWSSPVIPKIIDDSRVFTNFEEKTEQIENKDEKILKKNLKILKMNKNQLKKIKIYQKIFLQFLLCEMKKFYKQKK